MSAAALPADTLHVVFEWAGPPAFPAVARVSRFWHHAAGGVRYEGAPPRLRAHALSQALKRRSCAIAGRYALTPADARAHDGAALRRACAGGHLLSTQWLVIHFGLGGADARARGNRALRFACAYGRLELAQWLAVHFGLTTRDARAWDNWALRFACGIGHLEVAQWLVSFFGLTATDARACDDEALRAACGNGDLETARWLTETFGVSEKRLGVVRASHRPHTRGDPALRAARHGGRPVTAQWLTRWLATFQVGAAWGQLPRADDDGAPRLARSQGGPDVEVPISSRLACSNSHLATARWLAETFDLGLGAVSVARRAGDGGGCRCR